MATRTVRVRRVYEPAEPQDGARVLVDRLWPRGLRKDAVEIDDWARDVAPSAELRRWYGHDPARFAEFDARYRDELAAPQRRAALDRIRSRPGDLTLLTATRDAGHSHAEVLAALLRDPAAEQDADRHADRDSGHR